MVGIAWSLSSDRRRFPVRVVVGGLLMQFILAVLVLRSEIGQSIFQTIGNLFTNLLDCVDKGAGFVFGDNGVSTPTGFTPVTLAGPPLPQFHDAFRTHGGHGRRICNHRWRCHGRLRRTRCQPSPLANG